MNKTFDQGKDMAAELCRNFQINDPDGFYETQV